MSKFIGSGGDLGYTDAHCTDCFMRGHEAAHPDLGCADVGCDLTHPEPPRDPGRWTGVCSDGEHGTCAGFVGGPAYPCTCHCHPEGYSADQYARLIVRSFVNRTRGVPRWADVDEMTSDLMTDLRRAGVLRDGNAPV